MEISMHSKIAIQFSSLLFCILITWGQAFGQERMTKSGKEKPNQILEGAKVEIDLPLIYTSNAYKTPSERFVNPETGNWATATPTTGFYLNPTAKLGWNYDFLQNHGVVTELKLKRIQFVGSDKLKDANGNSMKLELGYEGHFGEHNLRLGNMSEMNDQNYIHRGTGESRLTEIAHVPEGHRYKYKSSGTFISYKYNIMKGSKIYFDLENSHKDYEEVVVFQSLDRDESLYRLTWSQRFTKAYKLRATHKILTKHYTSHNAEDVQGNLVSGTSRTLVDTTDTLKFTFKRKPYLITPYITQFKSQDTYEGYWSYNEQEMGVQIRYQFSKKLETSLDVNTLNRQYENETNRLGELRNRKARDYEFKWHYHLDDTSMANLSVDSYDQKDVDSYYSYNRLEITFGYNKEF